MGPRSTRGSYWHPREALRAIRLSSWIEHHSIPWARSTPSAVYSLPYITHEMMCLDYCAPTNLTLYGSWSKAQRTFVSSLETWVGSTIVKAPSIGASQAILSSGDPWDQLLCPKLTLGPHMMTCMESKEPSPCSWFMDPSHTIWYQEDSMWPSNNPTSVWCHQFG